MRILVVVARREDESTKPRHALPPDDAGNSNIHCERLSSCSIQHDERTLPQVFRLYSDLCQHTLPSQRTEKVVTSTITNNATEMISASFTNRPTSLNLLFIKLIASPLCQRFSFESSVPLSRSWCCAVRHNVACNKAESVILNGFQASSKLIAKALARKAVLSSTNVRSKSESHSYGVVACNDRAVAVCWSFGRQWVVRCRRLGGVK